MLVNVEQGAANPSVGTLLRLSSALGISLPALVEPPQQTPVRVTPAGTGAVLWTGANGGTGTLLTGTEQPDVVELWDWHLAPGEERQSEAHSRGTRELIHVATGTLVLSSGDDTVTLTVGDAASFPGDVVHGYANPHDTPTRFTLTVFDPGVGSAAHA